MKQLRLTQLCAPSILLSLLPALAGMAAGCGNRNSDADLAAVPGPKKTETIDLGRGVKMEFVLIPAGSFMMGSDTANPDEKPVHKVTLTKPFYLDKFEVTQEQWQAVMGSNPSHFKGPKLPVESVSWDDCQSFLTKLQEKTSKKFALPTEAQWEYACRAGTTTRYSFGDSHAGLAEHAWFTPHPGRIRLRLYSILPNFALRGWFARNSPGTTHPVGEKKANPWGFFDMHGNVYEWCADRHASYPSGDATNPQGASSGNSRVLRGGAWNLDADYLRSSYRGNLTPVYRNSFIGLRCVMVMGEASP